jgi:hypothetical protein
VQSDLLTFVHLWVCCVGDCEVRGSGDLRGGVCGSGGLRGGVLGSVDPFGERPCFLMSVEALVIGRMLTGVCGGVGLGGGELSGLSVSTARW